MDTLDKLRERGAELSDLEALDTLGRWDQQVMMPAGAAEARAKQLGTLTRLSHELAIDEQIGAWLSELDDAELDDIDRDIVRLTRRDWERARKVPTELATALSRAHAAGHDAWQKARAADDFQLFVPALEHNVELAREYADCLREEGQSAYEVLLSDFDHGLRIADISPQFERLAAELPELAARAAEHSPARELDVPIDAQRIAVDGTLARIGVEPGSWRVDVSAHPFSTAVGENDSRITTRYTDGKIEALLSSLHEYGHALYERQIDPRLSRTCAGGGTSMSIHESQSKLWENHVARHPAFAQVLCEELARGGFEIAPSELNAALVGVERSLIRVSADPITYPLHIILRYELELGLIDGDLEVADLPAAWNDGMQRLLGVDVPSDAVGVLQDVHWGEGAFGYFPSYALGCLIAAQLWEQLERDLGPRDEDLRRAEVSEIKSWLGEHVHRYGRRLDTVEVVRAATGNGIEAEPFLRYVAPLAG